MSVSAPSIPGPTGWTHAEDRQLTPTVLPQPQGRQAERRACAHASQGAERAGAARKAEGYSCVAGMSRVGCMSGVSLLVCPEWIWGSCIEDEMTTDDI